MSIGLLRTSAVLSSLLIAACSSGPAQDTPLFDGGVPGGDGGTEPDPTDDEPACTPGESDNQNTALTFDGADDHITMGVAPELGLETFTVEAWVRREGVGLQSGTGVGGIHLVPIAGKGRGETDQGNLNCNYAFGFVGGTLGADFEDSATGGNHPIVGKTAVPWGEWHHVAATYDGSTWRLYLDGKLDAQKQVNATPRADSIQHFGIGATFDSSGAPRGAFAGAMDEVRVWNRALSEQDLNANMYRSIASADGLVGRWALDAAGASVVDTAGENDGTVAGATVAEDGAVLDRGLPPTIKVPVPNNGATIRGDETELSVGAVDPEGDPVSVEFHAREVSAPASAQDFTIVVLPDTQYYSQDYASIFHDQTKWIVDNREAYNIVGVIHNGDIVNRSGEVYQWENADAAMGRLEEALADSKDGVPYGVTVGNHDLISFTPGEFARFDEWFGVDRFAGRGYYGGHYTTNSNSENWVHFTAGGVELVVVSLSYDTTPSAAVLNWAESIFEAHPNAFGILNSHALMFKSGAFDDQGSATYNALKDVANMELMTCGHRTAEVTRTHTFEGNVVHAMLADYQSIEDRQSGYLRIWEFSPANDELTVRSYSPTQDKFQTDANSQFTLEVDLPGAGSAFSAVNTVDAEAGVANVQLGGLEPGKTYEWYVTASDCTHTVQSPVYRFTIAP